MGRVVLLNRLLVKFFGLQSAPAILDRHSPARADNESQVSGLRTNRALVLTTSMAR